MGLVKGIYLLNLPYGIMEEELKLELLRIFPTIFAIPIQENELRVKVFPPLGFKTSAVVSGFLSDFDEMLLIADDNAIKGRKIVLKVDQGDERDDFGRFKTRLPPSARRSLFQLSGISHRKVLPVFNRTFLANANRKLFHGITQNTIYLNTNKCDEDALRLAAKLEYLRVDESSSVLRYFTTLDTMQAIRFLNNNPILCNPPAQFMDYTGKEISLCTDQKGLGIDGCLLNIADTVAQGIVTFDKLDPDVLNETLISIGGNSQCWRCKSKFKFTGINVNLNFIVGICSCKYLTNLDILNKQRAYYWPGERFTRLVPGPTDTDQFIIMHYPMKVTYSNPEEYQDVVLPIIQEEWKYSSAEFKKTNSWNGTIESFQFVETLTDRNNVQSDVYALQIDIPGAKIISVKPDVHIRKLTCTLKVTKLLNNGEKTLLTVIRKGKVWDIAKDAENKIQLFLQIKFEKETVPVFPQNLLVVPKLDKAEYNTSKHLIRRWVNEKNQKNQFFNLFLNPQNPCNWQFSPDDIVYRALTLSKCAGFLKLQKRLNSEQRQALENARNYSVSVIHGPPGTGKTFALSTIVCILTVQEKGPILACAPSNVATDGLGTYINQLGADLGIKVLRIYSKSKERVFLKNGTQQNACNEDSQRSMRFSCLHEEVKKIILQMEDKQITSIIQKVIEGNEYLLTQAQRELLDEKIQQTELQVMEHYDVFVCTIGALADTRVTTWNRKRSIQTVVIDEIGQVSPPSTLSAFLVNPTRMIFAGDHLQLKPTILSYAASLAGLDRSIMEWISLNKNNNTYPIPWITLLEQHRMVPVIRNIVSAVTYHNTLRDAESVMSRKIYVPEEMYTYFPELRISPIVIYNSDDPETKIRNSYINEGQAKSVLDIVQKMVTVGVTPSAITVLTLYEAQRELIQTKITNLGRKAKEISVVNVDGYQGRENSIIIISFVRCNATGSIGFTNNANRLNVALSRAKNFLFIISDFETLKKNKKQMWVTLTTELLKTATFHH